MSAKGFQLVDWNYTVDEEGGIVSLHFRADVPALCNAALPAGKALAAELAAAVDKVVVTEAKEAAAEARLQDDLKNAEARLECLAERSWKAKAELREALEAGRTQEAEQLSAEITDLPRKIEIAERQVKILRDRLPGADASTRYERSLIERRVREPREEVQRRKYYEARQRLADAVAKHLPQVMEARTLLEATNKYWIPIERGRPLTRQEIAAARERGVQV